MVTGDGINCKYHSTASSTTWCPYCGSPIYDRCTTSLSRWIGFSRGTSGRALIACPECSHRKMNRYLVIVSLLCLLYSSFILWIIFSPEIFLLSIFLKSYVVITLFYLMMRCERCGSTMCTACYKGGICRDCMYERLARALTAPPRIAALKILRRKDQKFCLLVLLPLFAVAASAFVPFSPLAHELKVLLLFFMTPLSAIGLEVWIMLSLASFKEMQRNRA